MLLLLSNNPKIEFLKCSQSSLCHQKILGLSTCCGQLHRMNMAATDSWLWFTDFSEYTVKEFIISSGKETGSRNRLQIRVHEREKADNSVPAVPHGSLRTGRQVAEWPKAPTSGVLLLSAGPLRSERCCFLGCSKPLHICERRQKGFQSLLPSEKLKNEEISVEVNDARIVRKIFTRNAISTE